MQNNSLVHETSADLTHMQGSMQPRTPDYLGAQKCLENNQLKESFWEKEANFMHCKILF